MPLYAAAATTRQGAEGDGHDQRRRRGDVATSCLRRGLRGRVAVADVRRWLRRRWLRTAGEHASPPPARRPRLRVPRDARRESARGERERARARQAALQRGAAAELTRRYDGAKGHEGRLADVPARAARGRATRTDGASCC